MNKKGSQQDVPACLRGCGDLLGECVEGVHTLFEKSTQHEIRHLREREREREREKKKRKRKKRVRETEREGEGEGEGGREKGGKGERRTHQLLLPFSTSVELLWRFSFFFEHFWKKTEKKQKMENPKNMALPLFCDVEH